MARRLGGLPPDAGVTRARLLSEALRRTHADLAELRRLHPDLAQAYQRAADRGGALEGAFDNELAGPAVSLMQGTPLMYKTAAILLT